MNYIFVVSAIFDPAEVSTLEKRNKNNEVDRGVRDVSIPSYNLEQSLSRAHRIENDISVKPGLGNMLADIRGSSRK